MGYFNSIDNLKDQPEILSSPRFSTIGYSFESFLNKLEEGSLSDMKIKDEILNGNYFNMDYFNDAKLRVVFQKIWTNKAFLQNLLILLDSNKIYRDKVISSNITSINHTVYDYMVSENADEETKLLMFDIAKIIDYNYILRLCSIMPLETARLMALAKFSSFDKKTSVERLNSVICKSGMDFSESDIIYIFSTFYSDRFSVLFNVLMTTKQDQFEERIQKKIYDMISLAIIDILNSMTSDDIYKVLYNYASYLELGGTTDVRFSLHSLSDDYDRINHIIDELSEKGISIP